MRKHTNVLCIVICFLVTTGVYEVFQGLKLKAVVGFDMMIDRILFTSSVVCLGYETKCVNS